MIVVRELCAVKRDEAAKLLGCSADELLYWAWPQIFGSTAGPFEGVGGQAVTTFIIEAWEFERDGRAVLFCAGKVLRVTNHFTPMRYINRRAGRESH